MTEKEFREKERRTAQRKAAHKAKKKRKRRALIAVTVTLILLVAVLIAFVGVSFFKIENISVSGNTVYTAEQIIAASELEKGDNLLLLSEKKLGEKLQKNLPYISGISLERELPSTLTVKVQETSEEMCFYSSGIFYTANSDGKILSEVTAQPEGLSVISAGEGFNFVKGEKYNCTDVKKAELLQKLLDFSKSGKYNVTLINVSDIYRSYIIIDNSLLIEFGSSSYLEQKLDFLPKMLEHMHNDEHNVADLGSWTPDNDEAISYQKDINSYLELK